MAADTTIDLTKAVSAMRLALNALEDVEAELEQPEIAEFISGALDRKVSRALATLRMTLGEE